MASIKYQYLIVLLVVFIMSACSSDSADDEEVSITPPEQEEVKVGYEILEAVSENEIIVWVSQEITQEEFNALELPDNWFKNQPRESDPSGAKFLRSPDAAVDGALEEAEHFGHIFQQNAKIIETNVSIDGQSLLNGTLVAKYHEITFDAGNVLYLLISPDGEQYVRITRDAGRSSEIPSVPDTWQTGEYQVPESLTFILPNPTMNIRLDNEDSFQGPITPIALEQLSNLAYGSVTADDNSEPPIELTTSLCEDPNNMAVIRDALGGNSSSPSYGEVNQAQYQRLLENPTYGPFYMVNLVNYRELAQYADGRESDLTGREANSLYSPLEFLEAIGAKIFFQAGVTDTVEGIDENWEEVTIVKYPCPIAFMAMSVHPEFQSRSIHKDAALESSIVMVTYTQEIPTFEIPQTPYPPTEDDPSFEYVQIMQYQDIADYPEGSNEPERSGIEAMDVYADEILESKFDAGLYPKMRLQVDGVLIGDGREWSSIWIDFVPSKTALDAVNETQEVIDAQIHRNAAVSAEYSLITTPQLTVASAPFERGSRYCEILIVKQDDNGYLADVWGTQGLNYCPQSELDLLDFESIKTDYNALQASLNGPRVWLVDSTITESNNTNREVAQFGGLLMSKLAQVEIDASAGNQPEIPPYKETTVLRSTSYVFDAGKLVYKLTSQDGYDYVMQSMSLIEDPTQTLEQLVNLEARLTLPEGWSYTSEILESELSLIVSGEATIITDDLGNTYQRL